MVGYWRGEEYDELVVKDRGDFSLSRSVNWVMVEGKGDGFGEGMVKGVWSGWNVEMDEGRKKDVVDVVKRYEV